MRAERACNIAVSTLGRISHESDGFALLSSDATGKTRLRNDLLCVARDQWRNLEFLDSLRPMAPLCWRDRMLNSLSNVQDLCRGLQKIKKC